MPSLPLPPALQSFHEKHATRLNGKQAQYLPTFGGDLPQLFFVIGDQVLGHPTKTLEGESPSARVSLELGDIDDLDEIVIYDGDDKTTLEETGTQWAGHVQLFAFAGDDESAYGPALVIDVAHPDLPIYAYMDGFFYVVDTKLEDFLHELEHGAEHDADD